MRGTEPGQYLAAQAPGAEYQTAVAQRKGQVGKRQPGIAGNAGRREEGNLVAAQDRPAGNVANAALGQMRDLGEYSAAAVAGFFSLQMTPHQLGKARAGVAETRQPICPGGAVDALQMKTMVLAMNMKACTHHGKGIGQRKR